MPHQRKYVPSHSGGTESQPSRAKRSISAWASHGFSSRLSRSTRCAFDSFTASFIGPSRTQKAEGRARFSARPPGRYPWLHRGLAEGYVIRDIAGAHQPTLYIARTWVPGGLARRGSSLCSHGKIHIVD